MKSIAQILWMGVLLLFAKTGYSQQPVMSADSIPLYSKVKGLIPDCDRSAVAFRYYNKGEWNFRAKAGFGYVLFMNNSGDAVNISDSFAIASVEDAQSNPLIKGIKGFIAGLSEDGRGGWCVSVNEQLTTFDGRFWLRINSEWAMYLRDGCLNPALVYDPSKSEGRGVISCDSITVIKCDTIRDTLYVKSEPTPCENCCPGDSLRFEEELAAVFVAERTSGDLEKWFGIYYEWQVYKLHRNDKLEPWMERLLSYYAGINALVGEEGIPFKPTCDTCGFWGPIPGGLAFKSQVYFGIQQRVFQKYGVFGFWEMRYAWLNTRHVRNKLFSDEGFGMRLGVRARFKLPKDFPVFREVKTDLGYQGKTFATTPDKLRVGGGGFAEIAVVIGARDKQIREEAHQKRLEKAHEQFVRDTMLRHERDSLQRIQDSIEVTAFFSRVSSDTIEIDRMALESDSDYIDPEPQKVLGLSVKPLPFTQTAKEGKVNKKRTEVLRLQEEHNALRLQMKSDPTKWSAFKTNNKKLKKAEKKLSRLEKKAGIKSGGKWRRLT